MVRLPGPDSFFGQMLSFAPQSLAQGFLDGDAEDDHGLTITREFGANPGNLRMLSHCPPGIGRNRPLVVVLHGCKQAAGSYDRGSGWSQLANRFGFALLLPEQRSTNNCNGCFNWFQTEDVTRDLGEVASITAMIRFMLREYDLDAERVFITGLSAGGAMTAAMLATYPELFAGGAIIAGLPYGSATTVQDAFGVMGQGRIRKPAELGSRVRAASTHQGPWPRLSIWQGDADRTVNPVNARELVKQWTDVHGLAMEAPDAKSIGTIEHKVWRGRDGQAQVELYTLPGFGHATPIDPMASLEAARCGSPTANPYILPAGISSTYVIAESWGLTDRRQRAYRPAIAALGQSPKIHPLWHNIFPGGATAVKELTAPDKLLGRILRSTGLVEDDERRG